MANREQRLYVADITKLPGWAGVSVTALFCLLGPLDGLAAVDKLPPLNPYGQQQRLSGKFIWFDLATHDVGAAKRFYGNLFGWECTTLGHDRHAYTLIRQRGRPIGGIVFDERASPKQNDSQWIGFISVPDVDRCQRVVSLHGGRMVLSPHLLKGRGKYALFSDQAGALFGVCQSSSGDPPDYLPQVGQWLWAEHWSPVPESAGKFYQAIAGYSMKRVPTLSNDAVFHLVSHGFARAGVVKTPDPQIKPGWLYYVRVKDIAQTIARAKEQGGKVLLAPDSNSNSARVAIIEDSNGAPLGLAEWDKPQEQRED